MSRPVSRTRAGGRALIAIATAALLLTACAGQDTTASQSSPGQSAPLATTDGQTPPTGSGSSQTVAALDRSVPQRVVIPSLGVSSTLETLGQNDKGAMTTPNDPDLAGWYEPGPTPGSQCAAVISDT